LVEIHYGTISKLAKYLLVHLCKKKIQTPKLGPIVIEAHLEKTFIAIVDDVDSSHASYEIIKILKSHELEEIIPPVPVPSLGVEMWVHRSTELIFCVFLKDGYRHISSVIKGDMSGLIFDE
jgi:hypothetical protein